MLNIDDCDLFDMNDPRQITGMVNDRNNDDFYYDRDSDEDEFESRKTFDHSFHDDEEEIEEEDEEDDDEDDTEATKRRNHLLRTQLIIEAKCPNMDSDDKRLMLTAFTTSDFAPWNAAQPTAFGGGQSNVFDDTNFSPDFSAHFPSRATKAVFYPIDPFATSFSDNTTQNENSFSFDTSPAFGDFDAVFGSSSTENTETKFDAVFPPVDSTADQKSSGDIKTIDKLDVSVSLEDSSVVTDSLKSLPTSNGTVKPITDAKL